MSTFYIGFKQNLFYVSPNILINLAKFVSNIYFFIFIWTSLIYIKLPFKYFNLITNDTIKDKLGKQACVSGQTCGQTILLIRRNGH